MSKYISIIIFVLFVLAWVYPFRYAPWLTAENEFFILLIPCFLLLPLIRNKEFKLSEFSLFPLILFFFSFAQYLLLDSYFLEDLILVGLYLFFIVVVLITSELYKNKEYIALVLKIIIFLCLVNSVIVIFQYFNINSIFIMEHTGTKRYYGNIGQPNHLSTLFMMGIVSGQLLFHKKIIKVQTLYILSIYLIFFVFLTGSRTGILTLLFLAFLGILFKNQQSVKFSVTFFGTLTLIYSLCSYFFFKNSRNSVKNFSETINDSRLMLWKDSISSFMENPWLGYGINGIRTSRLFGELNFKVPYVSSHNIFLDAFLWFGVIGGIFFIAYFLLVLKKIYADKENGYMILLFLTPFFIHSLFEYPFRYLYFLVFIVPVFSLIKGVRVFYISRSVVMLMIVTYIAIISMIYIDFERYSRSAFFAQVKKCESVEGSPIVLDLMSNYAQLYCGSLSESEMQKVIYRYAYPMHVKYYLDLGYTDEKFIRFQQKTKSEN